MNDLRAALRSADRTVTEALESLGFRRASRGIFERPHSEAFEGWLGLNQSTLDGVSLYPVVGVTDRELETLLARLGGPGGGPSVSVQLGYLTDESRARAWEFTGDRRADADAAADLAVSVKRFALPFYAQNVHRRTLAGSIERLATEDDRWYRLPLVYGLTGEAARAAAVLAQATSDLQEDNSDAGKALRDFIMRCRDWLAAES